MLRITAIFLLLTVSSKITAQECEDKGGQCPAPSKFNQDTDWESANSIYDFHATDINGNDVPLEKYRGYVLIVVNVASLCGLTETNYKQLQELYNDYEKDGLRIIAFPSNQFAEQEPGTSEDIKNFVKQYGVTFDMFSKVNVNGEDAHPLWKWLKKQQSGFLTDNIKWNFTKFIVDKQGNVVKRFSPSTEPMEMKKTLQDYL